MKIAIKDRLLSRRVEVNSKCPVCNLVDETSLHALVFCPVAALCWQHQGFNFDNSAINNMTDWVQKIYQHSGRSEINKIFMIAWMIWNNRNDVVWKQRGREYKDIVTLAIQILNNWEFAQDKSFDFSFGFISQTEGDMCWKQPQTGTIKINTDAALFEDSNLYSYAMIARNHEGQMLQVKSSCRQGNADPEMAEAVGIREALSWIKEHNWPQGIVESDCLGAIQAIRCSSINLSYLGRVIDECKRLLLELKSRNVTLRFVKRSANMVAHYLARYSSSLADRSWEMGEAHSEFTHVLLNDLKV